MKYEPSKTLAQFHRDNSFVRGVRGPIGSGKSVAMCMEIFFRAGDQAPNSKGVRLTRAIVVRTTYRELETTTLKTWNDWMGQISTTKQTAPISSILRYALPDGTSVKCEVLFLALDTPADQRKLKSLEATFIWFNEAAEISRATFDMACGRVGRYPSKSQAPYTWSGVFMDTNPPDSDHWWYKLAEEDKPDGFKFWSQPPAIFPDPKKKGAYIPNAKAENVEHLQIGHTYWMRQVAGKDPEWIKVYLMGEYGALFDGKPVYQAYNDTIHCFDISVLPNNLIYRGWDFGLTPACVFAQVSAEGQLRLIDEIVSERSGIERFSEEVLRYSSEKYRDFQFADIGDPAGSAAAQTDMRSCFDIMWGKGIEISPGEIALEMRLESVRKCLNTMIDGMPGFVISPRCKTSRRGLQGGYSYKRMQVSGEKYSVKPDKNAYSHTQDCIQYIAAELFSGSLRDGGREYDEEIISFESTTHSYGENVCGY